MLIFCEPGESRTPNLQSRNLVLYPIKLQVPLLKHCKDTVLSLFFILKIEFNVF